MAKKELKRFFSEYLPAHPDVRASLAVASDHEFAKAVVDAGAAAGFAFSLSDVAEVAEAAGLSPARGELSESQLEAVAGGRKAGKGQQEYLVIKMADLLVSG